MLALNPPTLRCPLIPLILASLQACMKESLSLSSLIINEGEYYMPEEKEPKKKEEPKKKAKKSLVADKVKADIIVCFL